MPAHKVGRLWKFKVEEVDGWVRQGQANGGATTVTGDGKRISHGKGRQ